jgi:hypothetical protein
MRPAAKTTFRGLLVLAWLLPALNFDGFGPLARFGALTARLPQHAYFMASVSSLVLCLAATLGLWLFQPWARVAYIVGVVSYVYLMPFGWIVPGSFWFAVLPYFGAAIVGAIIAMSFLPPLAQMFAKRRSNQSLEPTAGRRDAHT